tara:strand:+ start:2099 stop:2407 length:309 start_codon:yes stop_codon:yes gene_type:complete
MKTIQIPILNASDIVRNKLSKGDKHCLLGWCRSLDPRPKLAMLNAIGEVLRERCGYDDDPFSSDFIIAEFNDYLSTSKKHIAWVWNQARGRVLENDANKTSN